jgi:Cupin-like domain
MSWCFQCSSSCRRLLQTISTACRVVAFLSLLFVVHASVASNEELLQEKDDYKCNIPRWTTADLLERFPHTGGLLPALYPHPVIIVRNITTTNAWFRDTATTRDGLLQHFSHNFTVTVSSSNSYSEHKRNMLLSEYLEHSWQQHTTPYDQRSNDSIYLFGETYSAEWNDLLQHYSLPPCTSCVRPNGSDNNNDTATRATATSSSNTPVALSFGIGNRHSGVSWHVHGPGFSEVLHGTKHWLLYPPNINATLLSSNRNGNTNGTLKGSKNTSASPIFHDANQSTLQWMHDVYPYIEPRPYECTLQPGQAIYFPTSWWHATLNLHRYTAFISTFTTEHLHQNDNQDHANVLSSTMFSTTTSAHRKSRSHPSTTIQSSPHKDPTSGDVCTSSDGSIGGGGSSSSCSAKTAP